MKLFKTKKSKLIQAHLLHDSEGYFIDYCDFQYFDDPDHHYHHHFPIGLVEKSDLT